MDTCFNFDCTNVRNRCFGPQTGACMDSITWSFVIEQELIIPPHSRQFIVRSLLIIHQNSKSDKTFLRYFNISVENLHSDIRE